MVYLSKMYLHHTGEYNSCLPKTYLSSGCQIIGMHATIRSLSRKREGISAIYIILLLVIGIFVAAVTIPFFTKTLSNLGLFSDDKISQDDESLSAEMIRLSDSNNVNIDTGTLKSSTKIGFEITSPFATTIADCSLMTSDYCNYIDVSVSNSPPKYTYIPEGVTISVSFDNDSLYSSAEGYAEITVSNLYQVNKTLLSDGKELAVCKVPFETTCYVYNPAPPVTYLRLRVKLGNDISVKVPFYYDNYYNGRGVVNEDSAGCEANPLGYLNIEPQTTELNIRVDGPSESYDVTVVHVENAEKPHVREYAVACGESISSGSSKPFAVQVVSGDYDFFRIYGWEDFDCIKSLMDIPVKKGTTKYVTLRFSC